MKLPPVKRIRLSLLCWIAATFLLLAPMASQEGSTDFLIRTALRGTRGGNLVAGISADPSNFNRMFSAGLSNSLIAERLSADLVHINRSSFALEPSIASSWEADANGTTYILHLRRGLRFSDGQPFTAEDVLFTFLALQDQKSLPDLAGQLQVDGKFPAVSKVDAYTVRLEFPRPVGMGLRALDSIPVLPRHRLQAAYEKGTLRTAWGPGVNPGDVAGLGPFRLKEYQRGIKVVLERNPYYWKKDGKGQGLPYLDSVTFLVVQDRNAESLRFQAGEIDVVHSLTPESYAALRREQKSAGFQLKDLGSGLRMDFLWFNLNPGRNASGQPFVDPEKMEIFQKSQFRRAVSYALNRSGMSRSIFLGLGDPQYGPLSTGNRSWFNPEIPRTEYDPAMARKLLAEAGLRDSNRDGVLEYPKRGAPFEFTLLTARGSMTREKMAQVIAENLQAVGIRARTEFLVTNEIAARFLETFDYEAILFGITPSDVAPDLQTDLWFSNGGLHFWFPGQPKPWYPWEAELDRLTSSLVRSIDPAIRKRTCDRMQVLWAEQMPAIPTLAPHEIVGWKDSVENVSPSILAPFLLWNAEELSLKRR